MITSKAVELEETVPNDTADAVGGLIFNRYLHGVRDTSRRRWIHVDGAIKAYPQGGYGPKRALTGAPKGATVAYLKLYGVWTAT